MTPERRTVLVVWIIALAAGCAQQPADERRAASGPRVRPQSDPAAASSQAQPPQAVVVRPPAPPEPHPLAPESLPNKPQTIPEEVPGTKPPQDSPAR